MAVFICKTCGASLTVPEGAKECVCEYCGTHQTVSRILYEEDFSTLQSLLERGRIALDDHEWEQADAFFEKALNKNPHIASAYWGKFLAKNHVTERMCLDGSFIERYEKAEPEEFNVDFADEPHIREMVEKYQIPNFLSADDIRKQYSLSKSLYSQVSNLQKERESLLRQFRTDRTLARALEFSDEKGKKKIEQCIAAMTEVMDNRVAAAKKEYDDSLESIKKQVISMNLNAQNRREAIYLDCIKASKTAQTGSEWKRIQNRLMPLGNYKDTKELIWEIQKLIEREETRLRQAQSAVKSTNGIINFVKSNWFLIILVIGLISRCGSNTEKNTKYNQAESLRSGERYEEAIEIYKDLGSYKDSKDQLRKLQSMLNENNYKEALSLMAAEKYEEAAEKFTNLGNYENSKDYLEQCKKLITENQYQTAISLKNDRKFIESFELFQKLGNYKDSADQMIEVAYLYNYDLALENYNEKNYPEAIRLFTQLGAYQDSKNLKKEAIDSYVKNLQSIDKKAAAEELLSLEKTVLIEVSQEIPISTWIGLIDNVETEISISLLNNISAKRIITILDSLDASRSEKINNGLSEMTKFRMANLNVKPGEKIILGKFEQDNNTDNGDELIEWVVLSTEENRILLLSNYALTADYSVENSNSKSDTSQWKESRSRKWLNNDFLQKSFTSEEIYWIGAYPVSAEIYQGMQYQAYPHGNTRDKIFLLSASETESYLPEKESRQCSATVYMKGLGKTQLRTDGNCGWWLRTSGSGNNKVMIVEADGTINNYGVQVTKGNSYYYGIRPALWLDL